MIFLHDYKLTLVRVWFYEGSFWDNLIIGKINKRYIVQQYIYTYNRQAKPPHLMNSWKSITLFQSIRKACKFQQRKCTRYSMSPRSLTMSMSPGTLNNIFAPRATHICWNELTLEIVATVHYYQPCFQHLTSRIFRFCLVNFN